MDGKGEARGARGGDDFDIEEEERPRAVPLDIWDRLQRSQEAMITKIFQEMNVTKVMVEERAVEREVQREARMEEVRRQEAEVRQREAEARDRAAQLRLEELKLEQLEQRREETRVRREEEDRKARLRLIQLPPPMTQRTDLLEYIDLFQGIARRKELPRDDWAPLLIPLLNDKYRGMALKLPVETKEDFEALRKVLLDRDDGNNRNAAASFWTAPKRRGTSALEHISELGRLTDRFMKGEDRATLLDCLVKERFIHNLPKEGRAYLRTKNPATALEAARLAEEHFHNHEQTYTEWTTSGELDQGLADQQSSRDRYQHRRWQKGQPRQQQNVSPKRGRDEETETASPSGVGTNSNPQPAVTPEGEARPQRRNQGKQRKDPRSGKCFRCGEPGHRQVECKTKVNRIEAISTKRLKNSLRPGKVGGKEVQDILLDSGAEISLIRKGLLPTGWKKSGDVAFSTASGHTLKRLRTRVEVEMGTRQFTLDCGVVEDPLMSVPLLVGDNVPGIPLLHLMLETAPADQQPNWKEMAERMDRPSRVQTEQPETDAPSGVGTNATPQLAETPEEEVEQQTEREEPAQVNRLQLVNALMRAQTRRQRETEEEDQKATETSEAVITSWEQVQPLEETPKEGDQTGSGNWASEEELDSVTPTCPRSRREMKLAQRRDDTLKELWAAAGQEDSPFVTRNGLLHKKSHDQLGEKTYLLVLPEMCRRKAFEQAHSAPLARHFGARKSIKKITNFFYWPQVSKDVTRWVKGCEQCQRRNRGVSQRSPLQPLPVIDEPWQRVAMDIVGPLPKSKGGYRYLLTVMDYASRYPEAIPLRRVDTETVAEALLQVFARYGIPDQILTDNGATFTSKLMQHIMKTLDITALRTSPYHPQTNGMIERWHRTLKTLLAKLDKPEAWMRALTMALFAARDAPHQATGFTPFQLLFGYHVNGPMAVLHRVWTGSTRTPTKILQYLQRMKETMVKAVQAANTSEVKAKAKMKTSYDKETVEDELAEGEEVLLLHPALESGWKACWEGPYVVQQKISPTTYRLNTPGKRGSIMHRNSLKRFVRSLQVNHVVLADGELDGEGQLELPGLPGTETVTDTRKDGRAALTEDQRGDLDRLLEERKELFSDVPGITKLIKMEIKMDGSPPKCLHPYRIPLRWRKKLEKEVLTLKKMGIIEASTSPWAAPVVCVAKPNGDLRMCVNYRALNLVTATDAYPLPRIEELLDRVAPARFITTMDLCKGYYQVPLAEEDRCKTAFVTPAGKFQFTRMPFGLKNAPAVFQRLMDGVLGGLDFSAAYIDDVVIMSESWEEHLRHLRITMDKIAEAGLKVKRSKCVFGKAELEFLGHKIGEGGVKPQEAKVTAIKDFPRPKTKTDLRAFLGLVGYYRRFIPGFAQRSAALTDLTSKKCSEVISWTDQLIDDFQMLRDALTKESTLGAFQQDRETILHTDASERGIGGVLLQKNPDGVETPVAFYSRKLMDRERRYTITEKECLAIVETVRHFQAYLLGAPFRVIMDHKALLAIPRMTSGGARVVRWAIALQPFDFQLEHKPGRVHGDADALSRMPWTDTLVPVDDRSPSSPQAVGAEGWRRGVGPRGLRTLVSGPLWSRAGLYS